VNTGPSKPSCRCIEEQDSAHQMDENPDRDGFERGYVTLICVFTYDKFQLLDCSWLDIDCPANERAGIYGWNLVRHYGSLYLMGLGRP